GDGVGVRTVPGVIPSEVQGDDFVATVQPDAPRVTSVADRVPFDDDLVLDVADAHPHVGVVDVEVRIDVCDLAHAQSGCAAGLAGRLAEHRGRRPLRAADLQDLLSDHPISPHSG